MDSRGLTFAKIPRDSSCEVRGTLGGSHKPDADRGATARAVECRERRLGLAEGRNEAQTIGFRHGSLALRAAEFPTLQLGMSRLKVGETDSLLPPHVAPLFTLSLPGQPGNRAIRPRTGRRPCRGGRLRPTNLPPQSTGYAGPRRPARQSRWRRALRLPARSTPRGRQIGSAPAHRCRAIRSLRPAARGIRSPARGHRLPR